MAEYFTFRHLLMLLGNIFIFYGLYQYYWIYMIHHSYKDIKDEIDKDIFEYICEVIDNPLWRYRKYKVEKTHKEFKIKRYFRHKKIRGLISIVIGLLVFIVIIWFSYTPYGFLLDVIL